MKKAFTLAEVLITITVIGIISAIVLPVALHSRPDENIMKFKKGHNTIYQVISTLISSDKYYKDGDLGKKADDTLAGKSFFCETFADVLNTKNVNCDFDINKKDIFAICSLNGEGICVTVEDDKKATIDANCKTTEEEAGNTLIGIETPDGIHYFERSQQNPFGCKYGVDCTYTTADWTEPMNEKRLFNEDVTDLVRFDDGLKTNRFYRIFCMDVDEFNGGEDPFGYAVRVDGLIMTGKRADEWLAKDPQKED